MSESILCIIFFNEIRGNSIETHRSSNSGGTDTYFFNNCLVLSNKTFNSHRLDSREGVPKMTPLVYAPACIFPSSIMHASINQIT